MPCTKIETMTVTASATAGQISGNAARSLASTA
jgi:hypothetical protein